MKKVRRDDLADFYKKTKSAGFGTTTGGVSSKIANATNPQQQQTKTDQKWYSADNIKKATDVLGSISGTAVNVWSAIENVNLQKKVANSQIQNGQAVTPINGQNTYISNEPNSGLIAQNAKDLKDDADASKKSMQMYILIGIGVLVVGGAAFMLIKRNPGTPQMVVASPPVAPNIPGA